MNEKPLLQWLQDHASSHPNRADRWYHLALALGHEGERWDALSALGKATAINPHYAEAGVLRSFLLAESGEIAEGFREFRLLYARSPEDFQVLFPLGVFCMRFGWESTGLELLLRAEALRPGIPHVVLTTAAAYQALGDTEAAVERIEWARASVVSKPVEQELARDAHSAFELRGWQRWENPSLAKVFAIRADFLRSRGDLDAAERELRTGNARHPGHQGLMVSLASLLIAKGRNAEAQEWLRAAIALDRTSHQAYFESAFLHAEDGDLEKAREALETAVELRPLYPDYRYQLGILLLDLGRAEEGILQLERVRMLNPFSGHLTLHLVSAYLERGRVDEAIRVLTDSTPQDVPEAILLAAHACLERGCEDEARGILERVLEEAQTPESAAQVLDRLRAPTALSVRQQG